MKERTKEKERKEKERGEKSSSVYWAHSTHRESKVRMGKTSFMGEYDHISLSLLQTFITPLPTFPPSITLLFDLEKEPLWPLLGKE